MDSRTRLAGILSTSKPPEGGPHILELPIDVLTAILSHIHGVQDAVSFAITCKLLQAIGQERVDNLLNDLRGDWKGDRIICVGDFASINGAPAGTMTQEELDDPEIHNLYHLGSKHFEKFN